MFVINKLKFDSESCHESVLHNHGMICPGKLTKILSKCLKVSWVNWHHVSVTGPLGDSRALGWLLQEGKGGHTNGPGVLTFSRAFIIEI